jgi:hypothetical protein
MPVMFREARSTEGGNGVAFNALRPASVVEGDLLIMSLWMDLDLGASNMPTVSGWTVVADHTTQTGAGFLRILRRIAVAGEPTSYAIPSRNGAADCEAHIIAFQAGTFDPASPVQGAVTAGYATTNVHLAPDVQGISGAMLLTQLHAGGNGDATRTWSNQTSGLTERLDVGLVDSYVHSASYTSDLTTTAMTGTRQATCSVSAQHVGVSIVIAPYVQRTTPRIRSASVASFNFQGIIQRPATVVAGDLMLAMMWTDHTSNPSTVPAGWTRVGATAVYPYFNLYRKTAVAADVTATQYQWGPMHAEESFVGQILCLEQGTFDPTTPITTPVYQFPQTQNTTNSTSHTAPSSNVAVATALLICSWANAGGSATQGSETYTPPAGMTQLGDTTDAFLMAMFAREDRTITGATGTRVAASTINRPYQAMSFVIQPAATAVVNATATATDTAAIVDSVTASLGAFRTMLDAAGITDSVTWKISPGRTMTDSAAITDSVTWRATVFKERVDRIPTSDHLTWELITPEISDYQFVMPTVGPRVVLGRGETIVVERFVPAYGEGRNQDQDAPNGGHRAFGVDERTAGVWTFELFTDTPNAKQALEWVELMAQAWDAPHIRRTPSAVVPLQYKRAGQLRRVYGRPRNFQAPPGTLIQNGRMPITAEFHLVEDLFYEDAEQSVGVGMTPTPTGAQRKSGFRFPVRFPIRSTEIPGQGRARTEMITIGGRQPTPAVISIIGPVVNPWVKIGERTWGLRGEVASGETIHLSGLPWAQTVFSSDGVFRPDMLDPRARLAHLKLEPGSHPLTFGGFDTSGSARAVVRWRNAYRGW